ncbi:TetR/AcrR family transcriptional regulator [Shewanella sp. UCD-KL12]|uniref:TetR/AcrR family transcriptional regulator n=1 Tax=Shewanella sp. UCD-KL12 TaxID=1917163 RepID=UPI000970BF09|nr:TetR/AcrR family transcriptional regulator [Shewanella sp. UCD-KL12]
MVDKKKSRSELKRTAVIEAAMAEFEAKGFKAASMDDIAKRAEVSKRTVYNHFANKDALFSAIMVEMMSLLCTFEHVPFSTDTSIEQQLTLVAEQEISHLRSEAFLSMARVIIAEAIHSPDLIQEAMLEFSDKESPLTSWFYAAAEAGALKTDHPEVVVTQFMAVIKAFCFWPQLIQGASFPTDDEVQRVKQTAVDMVIKQYT